jgi:Tfp pilus assembly protein PilX
MNIISLRKRQSGTTLVIGMLMLVMMTLLAITGFNLGRGEYQIISNMQFQSEAASAAQMALEQVVSNLTFSSNPANVFASPCSGANTICYDTNGDTQNDVTVKIGSRNDPDKPVCIKASIIKNAVLDLAKPDDLGCAAGASQAFGIAGAATGDSLCAESTWDVQAQAVDTVTQARATITEGLSVRVSSDNIINSCP